MIKFIRLDCCYVSMLLGFYVDMNYPVLGSVFHPFDFYVDDF